MKKMHQVELLGGRQIVLRGLSLFAGSLLACTFAFAQNSIQSLTGSVQSGAEVIRIETAEPLSAVPSGFTIQSPARIALDFPGVVNGIGRSALDIGQGNIRSANVVQAGDRTRVVINLKQPSTYQAKLDGKTLLLVLDGSSSASPTSVAQAAPAVAVERVDDQSDDNPRAEPLPRLIRQSGHDEHAGGNPERRHDPHQRHLERPRPIRLLEAQHQHACAHQ